MLSKTKHGIGQRYILSQNMPAFTNTYTTWQVDKVKLGVEFQSREHIKPVSHQTPNYLKFVPLFLCYRNFLNFQM